MLYGHWAVEALLGLAWLPDGRIRYESHVQSPGGADWPSLPGTGKGLRRFPLSSLVPAAQVRAGSMRTTDPVHAQTVQPP